MLYHAAEDKGGCWFLRSSMFKSLHPVVGPAWMNYRDDGTHALLLIPPLSLRPTTRNYLYLLFFKVVVLAI